MNSTITPEHGKDVADETNEERQSLSWPCTPVRKLGEDIMGGSFVRCQLSSISICLHLGIPSRTYIYDRDQDREEPHNMDDQDESFNLGQDPARDRIDEHSDYNRSPEKQGSVP